MTQHGQKMRILALLLAGAVLGSCQDEPGAPPRFTFEMYNECEQIERVWEPDYVRLAKRRFDRGQNVFLYKSPPAGGHQLYAGLLDEQRNLTEAARTAIAQGGSWGVTYPDTGCANIPTDVDEHYVARYNRFALTLFADQ